MAFLDLRISVLLLMGVIISRSLAMKLDGDKGLVTDACDEFNSQIAQIRKIETIFPFTGACGACVARKCIFTQIMARPETEYMCSKTYPVNNSTNTYWSFDECPPSNDKPSMSSTTPQEVMSDIPAGDPYADVNPIVEELTAQSVYAGCSACVTRSHCLFTEELGPTKVYMCTQTYPVLTYLRTYSWTLGECTQNYEPSQLSSTPHEIMSTSTNTPFSLASTTPHEMMSTSTNTPPSLPSTTPHEVMSTSTVAQPPTSIPAYCSSYCQSTSFAGGCAFTLALCGLGFVIGRFYSNLYPKFN